MHYVWSVIAMMFASGLLAWGVIEMTEDVHPDWLHDVAFLCTLVPICIMAGAMLSSAGIGFPMPPVTGPAIG